MYLFIVDTSIIHILASVLCFSELYPLLVACYYVLFTTVRLEPKVLHILTPPL
jgi:hypothetical protein